MEAQFIDENSLQELSEIENESHVADLPASQEPELKDSDTLLVELVCQYPLLYNKQLKEYKNNSMRENCWLQISVVLNKEASECSKRWSQLRESYAREKKRREVETRSGSGMSKRKGFCLYENMLFLRDHIQKRKTFTNAAAPLMSPFHIRTPFMPMNIRNCDTERFLMPPLNTRIINSTPTLHMPVLSATKSVVLDDGTQMPPPRMPTPLQYLAPSTPISRSQEAGPHCDASISLRTLAPQSIYSPQLSHDTLSNTEFLTAPGSENSYHLQTPPAAILPPNTPSPTPPSDTALPLPNTPSPSTPMLSPSTPMTPPISPLPSPSTSMLPSKPGTVHQLHGNFRLDPASKTKATHSLLTQSSTELTSPESPYSQHSSFGDSSSPWSGFDVAENEDWVNSPSTNTLPERPNASSTRNPSNSRSAVRLDATRALPANSRCQEYVQSPRKLSQPESCFDKDTMKSKKVDRVESSFLSLSSVLQNHFENHESKLTEQKAMTSEQAFGNLIATELEKMTELDKTKKKTRILQILYE